jgi:hypothetical protein
MSLLVSSGSGPVGGPLSTASERFIPSLHELEFSVAPLRNVGEREAADALKEFGRA